jgi:hypothetical protein
MVFNCILLSAIAYTTQNLENMVVKISDKRAKTPLDIISQLIYLSLFTMIVTVSQTSGWIQIVFTIFSIVYLLIVTLGFFIYYR